MFLTIGYWNGLINNSFIDIFERAVLASLCSNIPKLNELKFLILTIYLSDYFKSKINLTNL